MIRFVLLSLAIACADPSDPSPEPVPAGDPLEVTYLGVGGYLLRFGEDTVLTPPLYSNPDFFETTFGDIASDPALVDRFGGEVPFEEVDAVLVGHAHYDHLMDLPTLWPRTGGAPIYATATARHLLAAYAPDRSDCSGPRPEIEIPRDRVFQLDDPVGELGHDSVDYRMCADLGVGEGEWIAVDGTNVRFRALCSLHPDQLGGLHFGAGSLDADLCEPPTRADDWKEGLTLSFLVDFLDPATDLPLHRVYYQDAPTEAPTGLFVPELLDEKAVDVALMNVGSFSVVDDHPGASLEQMAPRYTIGGHWEDFFRTQDEVYLPILGHDIDLYAARAEAAMAGDEPPALVGRIESGARQWVPDPNTAFSFPAEAPY